MKIARFSIKRPSAIIICSAILLLSGIYSLMNINQELMPEIATGTISISTLYPGAAAQEVENAVTKKIEEAVSSLEGVDDITATSMENFSLVTINLKGSSNLSKAMQDAQKEINAIRADLPEDVKNPSITDFKITDIPIMTIGVTSMIEEMNLFDIVDREIKPQLERIPGVGRVSLIGGLEKEVQVNIDEDKLKSYGLSIGDIARVIRISNTDFPVGKLINEDKQMQIRLDGRFKKPSDIGDVVVKTLPDATAIKVKDIAEVAETHKEVTTINRTNGIPSVGITIQRSSDANTVEISKAVTTRLESLQTKYLKEKMSFVVAVDNAEFTVQSADSVLFDLFLATILVAATVFLFLQSFRNSIFAAVAIPFSLIITFIPMLLLGFSLNIMSLLALTLVIGILVDDAIVVVENIHKHVESGKTVTQAAYDGVRQIGSTVLSITLVIVVVFLPISLTEGTISDVFRQFALTIAISVLISLIVSFTVVPLLYSRFGKYEHNRKNSLLRKFHLLFEKAISDTALWFGNILKWSFSHRAIVLLIVGCMFTGSFSLIGMGFIGSDFAPQGDQGQFVIKLELPGEATLQHTNQITLKAENIVRSSRIVQNVFTTVGAADGGQAQARLSEIRVKLIPHNKRSVSAKDFAGSLKLELERTLPGTTISLGMTDMMGNIDESPVQYYIVGQNVDSVRIAANEILREIKNINGIMGPQISSKDGDPQISIVVNRDKIAHLGVSLENLGQTLNLAFNGNTDGKFLRGDMEYDINMKLDKSDRTHIGNIENLSLLNNGGKLILLKQFADIIETEGPKVLERRDRMPSVMISSQIAGRPLGDIGADINKAIENMHLSDQIEVIPGGELEMQDESSGSLGLALIISIFLVYAIMVLLYDSFVYPLVILASLPLAVIGALLALALTMETLNIFTMLGLVVLIGLVAKNAILLVDYTNHLKSKGVPLQEALINAANQRFRPIVMTTLAMVIGMLPVALATGAAAEWKNGLGWVIIGGLISSLFLTLIVVPLLYYIMERIMIRIGLNKHKEIVLVENEI